MNGQSARRAKSGIIETRQHFERNNFTVVPIIAEKMAAVLNTICFKSPEGIGTPSLSGLFQPHLNLQEELHRKERRSYYDTFEWRCFEHQTAVVVKNRTISLLDLQSGVESAPLSLKTSPSHFLPSILPPGTIRNRLESLAGLRALMKRCTIESDMVAFRILDRIEKTTGFLFAETLFLIKGTRKERISGLITLKPLKGFHDDIFIISRALEEHFGTENRLDVKSVFRLLMDSAGLRVNDYNPKINLSLRPGNPVRISAAELLLFTHGIMKCNEPGILGNIDTEFLHDYRVALRRTRSLLSQIKGIFPPEIILRYRQAFSDIGKKCNTLRDCDVYMLKKTAYFDTLPPLLAVHLSPFFGELEATRKVELKRFSDFLRSKTYRTMLDEWQLLLKDVLSAPGTERESDPGQEESISVAVKTIGKAWKKVIRHGRAIPAEASDSELHALRIDCKKLRYLLEFFSSLFPEKTIGPVVRHLKELQENLGAFVDLAVQQHALYRYIDSMKTKPANPELAAALGGLIVMLHRQQEKERKAFNQTFRRFDNDETETLVTELLNR